MAERRSSSDLTYRRPYTHTSRADQTSGFRPEQGLPGEHCEKRHAFCVFVIHRGSCGARYSSIVYGCTFKREEAFSYHMLYRLQRLIPLERAPPGRNAPLSTMPSTLQLQHRYPLAVYLVPRLLERLRKGGNTKRGRGVTRLAQETARNSAIEQPEENSAGQQRDFRKFGGLGGALHTPLFSTVSSVSSGCM